MDVNSFCLFIHVFIGGCYIQRYIHGLFLFLCNIYIFSIGNDYEVLDFGNFLSRCSFFLLIYILLLFLLYPEIHNLFFIDYEVLDCGIFVKRVLK